MTDYKKAFEELMVGYGAIDELERSMYLASSDNLAGLEAGGKAGCFACGEVFDASEVTGFTDGGTTGVCPRCGVDAVVPGSSRVPVSSDLLAAYRSCLPGACALQGSWGPGGMYACVLHVRRTSAWLEPGMDWDDYPLEVAHVVFNGRLREGENTIVDYGDDDGGAFVIGPDPELVTRAYCGPVSGGLESVHRSAERFEWLDVPLCDAFERWGVMLSRTPITHLWAFLPDYQEQPDDTFVSRSSLEAREEHFERVRAWGDEVENGPADDAGSACAGAQLLDCTPRGPRPLAAGEAYCCALHLHPGEPGGAELCAEVVANRIFSGELTVFGDDACPGGSELFLSFRERGGRYLVECGIDCNDRAALLADGELCRLELCEGGGEEAWCFALSGEPIDPARLLNRSMRGSGCAEPKAVGRSGRGADAALPAERAGSGVDGVREPRGAEGDEDGLWAPRTLADFVHRAVVRELGGGMSDVDCMVMDALENNEPLTIEEVLQWEWLLG